MVVRRSQSDSGGRARFVPFVIGVVVLVVGFTVMKSMLSKLAAAQATAHSPTPGDTSAVATATASDKSSRRMPCRSKAAAPSPAQRARSRRHLRQPDSRPSDHAGSAVSRSCRTGSAAGRAGPSADEVA